MPGSPAADAPVAIDGRAGWLLEYVGGASAVLYFAAPERVAELENLAQVAGATPVVVVVPAGCSAPATERITVVEDTDGLVARRYGAAPGTTYLLRPDQHVAARWRQWDAQALERALARASGRKEVAARAA